ncbi:nucleoside recognition domain-containing protein [Mucilaginibacter sp.]|jgi:spore maturation protein SpmA|uniref:nucleoside recognition domain-containing protein n=1 Tax=Mucilaginibacter sp. TaxID=1882438 RepID=UPI002CD98A9C|nr:nucleoside recognition domain-containing protein [Mucilaginibacter sp.]HTI61451.1 nucleoside recognition domain-containing protein [Mucilaginibacter sp.]
MALNYIWVAFFVIAFVIALVKLVFLGDTDAFKLIVDSLFSSSQAAVMDIALPLAGAMTLWLGIMNIGEKAGAIRVLSRIVGPFFQRIFPEIPKDHPAIGNLMMSFSANLLGLINAATPLGLKAMDSLQELNPKKDEASNAQIMFLVLLTSGMQLLPVTIIAQRAIMHAKDPTDIFIPCIIATYISAVVGMIAVAIKQKIKLFDGVIIAWLGGITLLISLLVWYMTTHLTKEEISTFSKVTSNLLLFIIPVLFIAGGLIKKINVFEVFIDGAKAGFETCIKIIPYLVAMLVGIAVFKSCGALGYMNDGLRWAVHSVGLDTRFVDAMPVAYMKPLSGSGSRAMMITLMEPKNFGPDSFVGRLGCIFNGSADTTFYIVALYFGSVGIKRSRYAIPFGLIADLAGIIAAIFVGYLFFG